MMLARKKILLTQLYITKSCNKRIDNLEEEHIEEEQIVLYSNGRRDNLEEEHLKEEQMEDNSKYN